MIATGNTIKSELWAFAEFGGVLLFFFVFGV
jgi:hypothetical protein